MSALTCDGQRISGLDFATTLEAAERRSERSQAIREGIAAGRSESAKEIATLRSQLQIATTLLREEIAALRLSIDLLEKGLFNEDEIRLLKRDLARAEIHTGIFEQLPGIKQETGDGGCVRAVSCWTSCSDL